jgi:hypothetical protein
MLHQMPAVESFNKIGASALGEDYLCCSATR